MVFTLVSIICIPYAAMAVSTYKWAYRKSVSTCRDDRRNDPYSTFFSVIWPTFYVCLALMFVYLLAAELRKAKARKAR